VSFIRRRNVLGLVLGLAMAVATAGQTLAATAARFEPLSILTSKGRANFQVEFVDTPKSRERGLMFRKSLAPDRGMLFDFKTERDVAFWMRNTFIGLDLIYIRADGTILSIIRGAKPFDETPLPSGGPVRGVLEIPAGRAAEIGALPGDRVLHRIFPKK
jgi:uncharacterized membrane protein (UPF0127 family)